MTGFLRVSVSPCETSCLVFFMADKKHGVLSSYKIFNSFLVVFSVLSVSSVV